MNKKIIVCIIVTLLFTTVIPILGIAEESKNKTIDIAMNGEYSISSSGMSNSKDVSKLNSEGSIITINNNNGDFLDQSQTSSCDHGWWIHKDHWVAQSFTPTLNILTRVQLYIFKWNNPPLNAEIVFSIRKSLKANNLTSITLTSDELPPNNYFVWIEIDFEDIEVTPNSLYYLVCEGTAGDSANCYCWLFDHDNPYKNGKAWYTPNHGENWYLEESPGYHDNDCCFKTYGYNMDLPVIEIDQMKGGFGFLAMIKNNGTGVGTDITWSIDVTGSLVFSGGHSGDVIAELAAGASTTIKSKGLWGIGPITITVQAGDVTKEATAFLLGPLVLRVTEL